MNANFELPRRPRITISKETTYILEPLRPDGYVDCIAGINQWCSAGVTPENNAAVPLLRAVGPKSIAIATRKRFFQLLGITDLPEEGPYLVAIEDFLPAHTDSTVSPGTTETDVSLPEETWKQIERVQSFPWSQDQFPELAELLATNREPLQLIVEGSRRPRFFAPLLGNDDEALVVSHFLALAPALRDAARQLRARAMLQLGQGRVIDAWNDALACHRLARLSAQGPLVVDALVSISLETLATLCSVAVVQHTDVTPEQARCWQLELLSLLPAPPLRDYWNYAERLCTLGNMTDTALHGVPDPFEVDFGDLLSTQETQQYLARRDVETKALRLFSDDLRIDWDEAFRYFNSRYDCIVAAVDEPTRLERDKAFSRLIDEGEEVYQEAMRQASNCDCLPREMTPQTIARHFTDLVWQSSFSTAQATLTIAYKRDVYVGFTSLALALAAHLHDRGAYPATLCELRPAYLAEMPIDPFNDHEFHYRREDDGYLLYSVGPNGKDDGGRNFMQDDEHWYENESASEEEQARDDIAIRTTGKNSTNN